MLDTLQRQRACTVSPRAACRALRQALPGTNRICATLLSVQTWMITHQPAARSGNTSVNFQAACWMLQLASGLKQPAACELFFQDCLALYFACS